MATGALHTHLRPDSLGELAQVLRRRLGLADRRRVAVERMRRVLVVRRHARGGRRLLVARHGVVSSRRKHRSRVRALGRRQRGGWGQHVTNAGRRRGGKRSLQVGEYDEHGRAWMSDGGMEDEGMRG
jgi:hypothetical protein